MDVPDYQDAQVDKTLHALLEYMKKQGSNDVLASEGEPISLQIGLKKVVDVQKKIKISLPHSVLASDNEVCLFVKDINLKDADETEHHFKDMLREKNVTGIAEVIPLRRVKTEYKEFEAKRNLSNLYSLFLADDRIVRLLPGFLGKAFFGRSKIPTQINLRASDLKAEMHTVLHTVFCRYKGRGPSSQVVVASTHLSEAQNAANIRAAVAKIAQEIPGGAKNIKSLHLRCAKSPALPIYITFGSPDDVVIEKPAKRKAVNEEAEDVTPVEGAKVIAKGNADFKIVKIRKKSKKQAANAKQTTEKTQKTKASKKSKVKTEPVSKQVTAKAKQTMEKTTKPEASKKSKVKAEVKTEVKAEVKKEVKTEVKKEVKAEVKTEHVLQQVTANVKQTPKTKASKKSKVKTEQVKTEQVEPTAMTAIKRKRVDNDVEPEPKTKKAKTPKRKAVK